MIVSQDHSFRDFDDPGPFRGKKRSLHEGGIRQTIAVQWKGTIAAGTETQHMFAFWDFLPTALDIAGVPHAAWPQTDGISALPTLTSGGGGGRGGMGEGFAGTGAGGGAVQQAHAFLYYEFCYYKNASGLLPQSYTPGWSQASTMKHNK